MNHLLGGEAGEHFDTELLGLFGQPAAQIAGTDHVAREVTARIVHALGHQGIGQFLGFLGVLEQVDFIARGGRGQRGAALIPVGKQLLQRTGLEDRPRENMSAHFGAFLHHADRQLLAGFLGLLHEPAGRR